MNVQGNVELFWGDLAPFHEAKVLDSLTNRHVFLDGVLGDLRSILIPDQTV